MKRLVIITSLFFAEIFVSHAQVCDVQKFKVIKTDYGCLSQNYYYKIGELNDAVIYTDDCPVLYPEVLTVNISNDTFSFDIKYELAMEFYYYGEAGLLLEDHVVFEPHALKSDFRPSDTNDVCFFGFNLLSVIENIGKKGVDFDQVTYWKIIIGISYSSQDGAYSDTAFYAGADTVTFRVVEGVNGMEKLENNQKVVSFFPNPAKTQFTVTNTENAEIQLFNILGQKVLQTRGTKENTVINTDALPQGLYVLKVMKDNFSAVHKIQIK
ncbi:MAG: T9SS type A sorting domain-containing protein [Bacteroidetes bacterium]|nr:T9SS type A sorting domain-containing protein [Bacteroidota bacterium]